MVTSPSFAPHLPVPFIERRKMKKLLIIPLALLAFPASSQAWSIHDFRVKDAGPEIVTRVTVCDPSPTVNRIHFRYRYENTEEVLTDRSTGRPDLRCLTWTHRIADTLAYEGTYYARIRVSMLGQAGYTSWKRFWSS
jgi:hypothetical protein